MPTKATELDSETENSTPGGAQRGAQAPETGMGEPTYTNALGPGTWLYIDTVHTIPDVYMF